MNPAFAGSFVKGTKVMSASTSQVSSAIFYLKSKARRATVLLHDTPRSWALLPASLKSEVTHNSVSADIGESLLASL